MVAFGGSEALAALTRRSRAVLGFGPRFGISVLPPDPDADAVGAAVRDVALYDTRGCMSPAAVLSEGPPPMDLFATRMAEAQERWPIGAVSPMEAAGIRTRIMLTRALGGEVRQGPGWVVLYSERFDPIALPRVLCVHPTSALPAVSAHVAHLGTVAGNAPEIPALRRCALGQMQTPRHDGVHEGIDVLRWIADLR